MPTDSATLPPTEPAGALHVTAINQRLDRVSFGLDNISDAVGLLLDRLQPILATPNPNVVGDDRPETDPDGAAPITLRLHVLQANAHYLADKVRAIAAAVEL